MLRHVGSFSGPRQRVVGIEPKARPDVFSERPCRLLRKAILDTEESMFHEMVNLFSCEMVEGFPVKMLHDEG